LKMLPTPSGYTPRAGCDWRGSSGPLRPAYRPGRGGSGRPLAEITAVSMSASKWCGRKLLTPMRGCGPHGKGSSNAFQEPAFASCQRSRKATGLGPMDQKQVQISRSSRRSDCSKAASVRSYHAHR
jgi:hypothetical protein